LDGVRLYVLVDGCESAAAFDRLVTALVTAEVHAIQLRDKALADRALAGRARQLRALTTGTRTLMFINDRPDVAVISHADGVHVGQDELSVEDVRAVAGSEMLVGVSTHSLEQVRGAARDGADLIGVGPTFPSTTKSFSVHPGPELLRLASAEVCLPIFAIGGIGQHNVAQVLATGVRRVAVGAAVTRAADPADAVRTLLEALESPS
jgi:thiamine-phosphate pyrophosphorylase